MTEYAKLTLNAHGDLVDTGQRRPLDPPPPHPAELAPGKPWWVPVVEEIDDQSTTERKAYSRWTTTVHADRIVRSRTITDSPEPTTDELSDAAQKSAFEDPTTAAILALVGRALNLSRQTLEADLTLELKAQYEAQKLADDPKETER